MSTTGEMRALRAVHRDRAMRERLERLGHRGLLGFRLKTPARILAHAVRETRSRHKQTGRHPLSFVADVCRQVDQAVRYGFPPETYYRFGLFDASRRGFASQIICHEQIIGLLSEINDLVAADDAALLADKQAFHAHCERTGLPTIPNFVEFRDGQPLFRKLSSIEQLPRADLFSKPSNLWCGIGAQRWRLGDDGHYTGRGGQAFSRPGLIAHLAEVSRENPLVLQPRISNHESLRRLSSGGICSLRVITARTESGDIAVLRSIQRLCAGDSDADNFAQGGLASPVDASGQLGPARRKEAVATSPDIHRHPDTNEMITGMGLPYFGESLELAKRAHRSFSRIPFVGWDIVATPDQAIVVEGNPVWCVELAQIPGLRPMAETDFPRLFLHHYRTAKTRTGNT